MMYLSSFGRKEQVKGWRAPEIIFIGFSEINEPD